MDIETIKKQAAEYGLEYMVKNPGSAKEVNDLYSLMLSEIEENSSPDSEYEKFIESVNQINL